MYHETEDGNKIYESSCFIGLPVNFSVQWQNLTNDMNDKFFTQ